MTKKYFMNIIKNIFFLLFILTSSLNLEGKNIGLWIEKGGIGEIRLGRPLKEVQSVLKNCNKRKGSRRLFLRCNYDGDKKINLTVENGYIQLISLDRGDNFKTKKSIGIGTLYNEVRKAYPRSELTVYYDNPEVGLVVILSEPSMCINFNFNSASLDHKKILKPKAYVVDLNSIIPFETVNEKQYLRGHPASLFKNLYVYAVIIHECKKE